MWISPGMYDESLFLRALATVRGEEESAPLVTREWCVFDVRVRILRYVCVCVSVRPGRLTSLFPSLS